MSNPKAKPDEQDFVPAERTEPMIRFPTEGTQPSITPGPTTTRRFDPTETTAPVRTSPSTATDASAAPDAGDAAQDTDPSALNPIEKTDTSVVAPEPTVPGINPYPAGGGRVETTEPAVPVLGAALEETQEMHSIATAADEEDDDDDRTEIVTHPQRAEARRRSSGTQPVAIPQGPETPEHEPTMIVARDSTGQALPREGSGRLVIAFTAFVVLAAAAVFAWRAGMLDAYMPTQAPTVAGIEELPVDQTIPLLQRGQTAARDRRWAEVAQLANTVLLLQPDNAVAMDLALKAADEMQADETIDAVRDAMAKSDWRLAWRLLDGAEASETRDGLRREVRQGLMTQLGHEASGGLQTGSLEQVEAVIVEMNRFGLDSTLIRDVQKRFEEKRAELERAAAEEYKQQSRESGRKSSRRNYRKERENKLKTAHVLYSDALGHISAKKNAEAKAALEKALKLNPRHAMAHRAMGIVLIRLSKKDQAAIHYRRYIELKPNAPEADKIRRMLDKFDK